MSPGIDIDRVERNSRYDEALLIFIYTLSLRHFMVERVSLLSMARCSACLLWICVTTLTSSIGLAANPTLSLHQQALVWPKNTEL